jgi:predicted tellurium resistance membrane protein TerC
MIAMNDNITKDYIQYSKRVTRWGIIMVTIAFILCLVSITFFTTQIEAISTIAKIYTAYITIMGVTIGAYQGNSSLEKWTKAKYQFEEVAKEDNNP